MKLMLLLAGMVMSLGCALVLHGRAAAELAPGVRISLVQTAGTSATYERIDIQNMSEQSVDVTGWKLVYKSASGGTTTTLLQIQSAGPAWHVLLDAGARESFVSNELAAGTPSDPALMTAERFAGGMSNTGGGLQLVTPDGMVMDIVGWGTAVDTIRLGGAAPALGTTTWLARQAVAGNNATDFVLETQSTLRRPFTIGSLVDVQDVCLNISDLQLIVPDGYSAVNGICQPIDVCLNLEGVQANLPVGMEQASDGTCTAIDVCQNLPDLQTEVPIGYELTGERQCEPAIIIRKLLITEVLPNPSGSDDGSEFVEIYNADTEPIALKDYKLMIGDTSASLPADRVLQPGEFLLLSDTDLGKHLPNTTGVPLYVLTVRNVEVMSVPAYMNAKDDVSWALFDDGWQYTYAPTPATANVLLTALPCDAGYERDAATGRCRKLDVVAATMPVPCRDGQYRSEETGRCRNIGAAQPSLTPCKEGQYRSEATNRCRSFATLAASSLKPCADDQFRNPLTNRCKSIASSDDVALADCGEGRERNPATNRCRNTVTATAPLAAFPVEPVKDTAAGFAGWWALGGVGALALGYGAWEWRREVRALAGRLKLPFLTK